MFDGPGAGPSFSRRRAGRAELWAAQPRMQGSRWLCQVPEEAGCTRRMAAPSAISRTSKVILLTMLRSPSAQLSVTYPEEPAPGPVMKGEHPPSLSNFVPVSGITMLTVVASTAITSTGPRPERAGSGTLARADTRTSHLPSRHDRTFVPSAGTSADGADEAEGVVGTVGATGADADVDGRLIAGESDEHAARAMPSNVSSRTRRHRRDRDGDWDWVMRVIPAPSPVRGVRLASIGHGIDGRRAQAS